VPEKETFLRVALSFFKIGAFGFGGGAALLPLFERELVENRQWMDKQRFEVTAAISSISPASLPVAFCAIWNPRYALISAFAYALPGPLIYLALLTGFSYIGEVGTTYLQYLSVGLIAFVLFLIYRFVKKNVISEEGATIRSRCFLIMITAFLLTGGTVLRKLGSLLFGLEASTPLLSINMLTLMLITFFIIIFVGHSLSKVRGGVALALSALYALANGKTGILQQWSTPLLVAMIVLAGVSVLFDVIRKRGERSERQPFTFEPRLLKNLLLFVVVAVLFASGVYLFSQDANVWDFSAKVITSSLTSFGGGEVYIGISQATFVQSGFIPEHLYNTQIIGIANTMPGPILVSIVTGVGYLYGSAAHGVGVGWLFGLLGIVLAVMITAVGAIVLSIFFEALKESHRLRMIIRYIMPVVCGMLLSIALSLLVQASSVLVGVGAPVLLALAAVLALFGALLFLHRTFHLNDLVLVLLSGIVAVAVLSIVA